MDIKQLDTIVLEENLPNHRLKRGIVGVPAEAVRVVCGEAPLFPGRFGHAREFADTVLAICRNSMTQVWIAKRVAMSSAISPSDRTWRDCTPPRRCDACTRPLRGFVNARERCRW